jgi:ATP-dependent DNA helicase RecG
MARAARVKIAWLHGELSRSERRAALDAVSSGEASIAIGTHALFQKGVSFKSLALAIVDEQHRFGVQQRLALGNGPRASSCRTS